MDLSTDSIVRECLLKLVEGRYENLLAVSASGCAPDLDISVQKCHDIVIYSVLFPEIQQKTIPKYLRPCVRHKMLRNENDKHILWLSAPREVFVSLCVI